MGGIRDHPAHAMELDNVNEVELVANITGQPPPIPTNCDDVKAEKSGGCTRDVRRKAAKDPPGRNQGKCCASQ